MTPPKAGMWLLDTEVGEYQQAGMQASFIVVEKGTESDHDHSKIQDSSSKVLSPFQGMGQ